MRVLVTGGAGFIGSHTVDKLIEKGAEVVVVDDLSAGKAENLNPKADFVKLDITSEQLAEAFGRYRPEYVIHLAAQVSVVKSLGNPVKDCLTNITGSVNLLENCRRHGVSKVVYASSAAVYGNPDHIEVSEETSNLPMSFYGVSKLTPENYLRVFNHLYGLRYTVLRYANVYGPRQDAAGEGGVVSIFATKVLAGENPVIFGDGEQTRDFVYVEDVAKANIRALKGGDMAALNVGTGIRTSVNRLFSVISQLTGACLKPVYSEARDGEILHSCMDVRKIKETLGWEPGFLLKEGLAKTVDFYRQS
ncbi:MAG: NAD-dependent epimerase/dehydratase family protein [Firmicutes bacterium]|nr:NAD-dependent epimerase/dehydratase family protein [Bacillota bacterium]